MTEYGDDGEYVELQVIYNKYIQVFIFFFILKILLIRNPKSKILITFLLNLILNLIIFMLT